MRTIKWELRSGAIAMTVVTLAVSSAALAAQQPAEANRYFQCKVQYNSAADYHPDYYRTHDYQEGSSFRLAFDLFKQLGDDYVLSRDPDPVMPGTGPGKLAIHRADGRFEANFPVELDAQRNPVTLIHLIGVCNVTVVASSNQTPARFNAKKKRSGSKARRLAQVPALPSQKAPREFPKSGLSPKEQSKLALTLMNSAQSGDKSQMMLLLAEGATAEDLGYKQLAQFVTPGSEAILDVLLTRGADPSAASTDGQTLLYAAVEARDPAAVAILLRHHATLESNSAETDPLRLALLQGMTGVAIALTKAGANPDRIWNEGDKALGNAVDLAQVMLDVQYLAFLTAAPPRPDSATTQEVRVGLAAWNAGRGGLGGNGGWNTSLTRATKEFQSLTGLPPTGHPSMAMLSALESKLAAVYLRAAKRGNVAQLQRFQEAFPSLANATDGAGLDALMLASYYGRPDAVRLLISSQAPINAKSNNGSNALLLAVLGQKHFKDRTLERLDVIDTLVAAGESGALQNTDGVSANSIGEHDHTLAAALGISVTTTPDTFYIAVLARPYGNGENGWNCTADWPRDWIEARWRSGALITSVSRVAGQWCVVTGNFILGSGGQATRDVTDDFSSTSHDMEAQGKALTDYATISGAAMAVYTDGRGATNGWATVQTDDLSDTIRNTVWGQNWEVERIEPAGDDTWLVIYGTTRGYGAQSDAIGSLQYVVNSIHSGWQEGKMVTSLSHSGSTWVAIMSTGSNEKDQSIITATSFSDLSAAIHAAFTSGQWRVDFITGGTLASTGLLH